RKVIKKTGISGNAYEFRCESCGASFALMPYDKLLSLIGSVPMFSILGYLAMRHGWVRSGFLTIALGVSGLPWVWTQIARRSRNPIPEGAPPRPDQVSVWPKVASSLMWTLLGTPLILFVFGAVVWLCFNLFTLFVCLPPLAIGWIFGVLDTLHAPGAI